MNARNITVRLPSKIFYILANFCKSEFYNGSNIRSVNGKTADIANNVTIDGGEIVLDTSVPQSPTVRDALAEETTARETGDATLHNSVDLLNEAIGDETENREAGDEILQENIDTVQSNVDAVQSNLNTEIGNREEGDATTLTSAKDYTDSQIASIDFDKYEAVETLPEPSQADQHTMYLTLKTPDPIVYEKYVVNNDKTAYIDLGDTANVDLSPYRTSASQDVIDNSKVDKITGKGLSANDYTDQEKELLQTNTEDIEELQKDLNNETAEREEADATLQTNLNTEETSRETADNNILSSLATEEYNRIWNDDIEKDERTLADEEFQNNINAKQNIIDEYYVQEQTATLSTDNKELAIVKTHKNPNTGDVKDYRLTITAGDHVAFVPAGDSSNPEIILEVEDLATSEELNAEIGNREEGDADTLQSAKTYTDNQIEQAELSKQIWLEAVQTKDNLADPSTLPAGTNYLCRVINDPTVSNNGVWQRIANTIEWTYFSDNQDFVDENELETALAPKANTVDVNEALALKQDNLNRTVQTNLASAAIITDTGNDIVPGVTGILPIANGGTGNGTGNSATATKLQTARTINGVSFDGTGNITINSNPAETIVSGRILKISGLQSGYSPQRRMLRITYFSSEEYEWLSPHIFWFYHSGRNLRRYANEMGDIADFAISDIADGSFTITHPKTWAYSPNYQWVVETRWANGLSVSAG